jgi:hypothetical protein
MHCTRSNAYEYATVTLSTMLLLSMGMAEQSWCLPHAIFSTSVHVHITNSFTNNNIINAWPVNAQSKTPILSCISTRHHLHIRVLYCVFAASKL